MKFSRPSVIVFWCMAIFSLFISIPALIFSISSFMFFQKAEAGFMANANLIQKNYAHSNEAHSMLNIEFKESILSLDEKINSRIDILDSAIKPEKKRRMLVSKIRHAVSETAYRKLTIRDLNNIAIAVIDYSHQYNLPISHILAQMRVESDFDKKAKSKAGAQGLMQIMPKTFRYIEFELGKRMNPWNPYHNIRAGCFYMAEQLHEFGNYDDALAAYNWGPESLKKFKAGEISKMPDETVDYVPRVKQFIEIFKGFGIE